MERQEALSLQLREARTLWERRDVRLLADAPILTDELNSIIAGSSETSRGEAPPCMMWRVSTDTHSHQAILRGKIFDQSNEAGRAEDVYSLYVLDS